MDVQMVKNLLTISYLKSVWTSGQNLIKKLRHNLIPSAVSATRDALSPKFNGSVGLFPILYVSSVWVCMIFYRLYTVAVVDLRLWRMFRGGRE